VERCSARRPGGHELARLVCPGCRYRPYVMAGHSTGGTSYRHASIRRKSPGSDRLGHAVSVRSPDYPTFYRMATRLGLLPSLVPGSTLVLDRLPLASRRRDGHERLP
jgi:hypothetical protein